MSTKANEAAGLRLGDTVASIAAPAERHGRVVGIMKRGRKDRRIIVRQFQTGDGWFPTGEPRYTAAGNLAPWPAGGDA